jgi:hypothetical protein
LREPARTSVDYDLEGFGRKGCPRSLLYHLAISLTSSRPPPLA